MPRQRTFNVFPGTRQWPNSISSGTRRPRSTVAITIAFPSWASASRGGSANTSPSRGIGFDVLVTGTLRRHRQTLEGILRGMNRDAGGDAIELPGLDEYDFRALVAAFAAAHADDPRVAAWRADPASKPAFYRLLKLAMLAWAAGELPGPLPETWADFMQRTEAAAAALQALTAQGARLLAISSGGAMSALLGGRLGLSPAHIADVNMQIRNSSVSHFHLNRERFLLSSWNAVPHLERAGRDDAITYG